MINKLINYLFDIRDNQRIGIALTKGALMMNARNVDLTRPNTWEFSGFSQNGEDGILQVLRKQLTSSNRYFIEIGVSDGIENNSAWLIVAEKYSGIMIEGSKKLARRAEKIAQRYSIGAECHNIFVTRESVENLKALAFHKDPDVFSLDIDGNDYYIAKAILEGGFRPKIFVVEYNSVYGAEQSVTVEYRDDFVFSSAHPTKLYYGVSVAGWRNFFESQGYRFVTVDQNGVNAFFVDPAFFDSTFLDNVQGLNFAENLYQYTKFRTSGAKQFALIANEKFVKIGH
ncbi:MAG: hypothetical protein V4552_02890 [Pseudomonadota bacterium]